MRASHPLLLSSQPAGSSEAGDPNVWESGGVSRAGSHPEEKPTAPLVLSRTQTCTGTPEHLHLTATAGGSLQEGVAGGHGRCGASARCVNEEVIQVARVSPSAAFIRSRSSSAIRGRERRSDTVGVGRRRRQPGKLLSRLGGGSGRKIKKREKGKWGRREGNQAQSSPDEAEAGGRLPGRAPLLCSAGCNQELIQSRLIGKASAPQRHPRHSVQRAAAQ